MHIRSQRQQEQIQLGAENRKQMEIVPTDHFVCVSILLNDQRKHARQIHG